MNRRELIAILGGLAIVRPLSAQAQQVGRMGRIGMLMGLTDDKEGKSFTAAFRQGLQTLGWMEGRNILIEVRWAAGDANRFRAYAAELVALAPDVILASSAASAAALHQETRSIPVVFVQVPDPIGFGLVASLARPGGNMTGFTSIEPTMGAKLVEVLKEIAPHIGRVVVVFNPLTASYVDILHSVETAARSFAMEPIPAPVHSAPEIEGTIGAQAREPRSGFVILPDAFTAAHRELITSLAGRHRLPSVYPYRYFITIGGLVSYGIDPNDVHRRSASYVDRILKGKKPADLPIQQPAKFVLTINLKTAKALGLTVPASLLTRADEVIE